MKTNYNSMKKIAMAAFICILAAVSFTNVFAQAPGQNNNGFGRMMPPMGGPQGQQMGQDMSGQNDNGFGQMPPMGGPQGQQMGQDMSGQNDNGFGQMPPMGGPQGQQMGQDMSGQNNNGFGQMPPMGGPQGQQMGQDMSGQNDNGFDQMPPMGGPQGQQMGQNMPGQNNNGFGQMPPMGGPQNDIFRLQDSINNVSDSDTQSTLQTLLDAYQSILDEAKDADEDDAESYREAASEALEDLLTAMNEAGIETPQPQGMPFNGNAQMNPGQGFEGNGPMGGPQNDTASLQNVIDEVTDADTKATLQTFLDAFETAIAAEKNGDSDEIETLRQSTSEAFNALMTALKDAGIEPPAQQPPFNGNGQMPPTPMGQKN